jgi:hypothetical protein
MKMAEPGVLALILVLGPCRAGKNLEWITAGLRKPMRGATSLVMRKNGSCTHTQTVYVSERVAFHNSTHTFLRV